MKYQNINIIGTGIYHPKNKVGNEFFVNHFNKIGIDVNGILTHLEREHRYLSDDPNENALTMGYEATIKALSEAEVKAEDIDMIIFSSDTPEYTSPSNALKVSNLIGAKNVKIVYDTNSNCIGMLTAFDQASRIMKTNKRIKKALVVGGLLISSVVRKDDPITYPNFADSGAAIVLESVEEENKRGFIDSTHFTDDQYHYSIMMPYAGYSKVLQNATEKEEDKKWTWTPFDFNFLSDNWASIISDVLTDNCLKPSDVGHFIFSQFSHPDSNATLEKLGVDKDNATYIGNEYGYTGVTSPVFALHRALKTKKIKEGSNVIFCSVGSGYTMISILYKF